MRLCDGFCDLDELAAVALRVSAEKLECLLFVDSVDGHQDAFCSFDDRAPAEGAFEVVELGEAAQHDVECRSEFVRFAVTRWAKIPRLAASLTKAGSLASRRRITGQAASWTICSISSSACVELSPRPTRATSGCSRRVTSPTLSTSSSSAKGEGAGAVLVDLSGCTFLDSTALAILVEATRRLGHTNGALRIIGAAPAVRRPFEITGLDRSFAFYPTRVAALDGESR